MKWGILLLALVLKCEASIAKSQDALSDILLQNEIRAGGIEPARGPVMILVDLQPENTSGIRRDFIGQLAKAKLSNAGIPASRYRGDYADDLESRRLKASELLSPKLTIEVGISNDESGYVSDCTLGFFEYNPVAGKSGRFRAQRTWFKKQTLKGVSRQDLEDSLVQYIQKELGGFVGTRIAQGHRTSKDTSEKDSVTPYSLKWNDPDSKRPRGGGRYLSPL